jgi:hypothetical protein
MPPPHNKTQRRRGPTTPAASAPTGAFETEAVMKATEDSLDALFAASDAATFHQPWAKLDRGARLDRLRKFVQAYPDLSPAERASLLTAILQAYELRQLNTKSAVEYDSASAQVTAIHGMRERKNTAGLRTFRIEAIRTTAKTRKATPNPSPPATD